MILIYERNSINLCSFQTLGDNQNSSIAGQVNLTSSGSGSPTKSTAAAFSFCQDSQSSQHISSNQRQALDQANKTSFGYFIPQDSSFGNIILPVIPRISPPTSTVPVDSNDSTSNLV